MIAIDAHTAIGELVRQRPARAAIFERLGIDYCCGGRQPLAEACAGRGLAVDEVLRQLDAPAEGAAAEGPDPAGMTLTQLVDHIVATHHAYLRQVMPRLDMLVHKVDAVHGANHAWLHEVAEVFEGFSAEIASHMLKEEQVLFPMIRRIEAGDLAAAGHCGSIANPIRVMMYEHDNAGQAMARMRALSNDYTPPADGCGSFRALLEGLADMERNMHQHVHKENNILFPRALQLAERGVAG